jgi:hypothetical protein
VTLCGAGPPEGSWSQGLSGNASGKIWEKTLRREHSTNDLLTLQSRHEGFTSSA